MANEAGTPNSTSLEIVVTQITLLRDALQAAVTLLNQQSQQKTDLVTTAADRFNTLSAQYQDELTAIRDTIAQLQTLKENWLVALEALHKTIDEQDRVLDDQAKITQRIGQMELTYERALAASQQ